MRAAVRPIVPALQQGRPALLLLKRRRQQPRPRLLPMPLPQRLLDLQERIQLRLGRKRKRLPRRVRVRRLPWTTRQNRIPMKLRVRRRMRANLRSPRQHGPRQRYREGVISRPRARSIFTETAFPRIALAQEPIYWLRLSNQMPRLKACWELCTRPVTVPRAICPLLIAGSGDRCGKTPKIPASNKT